MREGGRAGARRGDVPRARRPAWEAAPVEVEEAVAEEGQLSLFAELPSVPVPRGYVLPELVPVPAPPIHRVRRLSYSALALFERCSYRYYAERVAGLRERRGRRARGGGARGDRDRRRGAPAARAGRSGVAAAPDVSVVRTWYPSVADEELERIAAFVEAYCESELATRLASLTGVRPERPFAFEHDGVLLHGRLDLLHRDGPRALVVDYKTNMLGERTPDEIVEAEYHVQRLVYALACFRAGAEQVEVVYAFLERPDAVVSTTFALGDVPSLEAELSEAIARINAGEFVPTPGEFTCMGCPALDVVCAGPRLRGGGVPDVARGRRQRLSRFGQVRGGRLWTNCHEVGTHSGLRRR